MLGGALYKLCEEREDFPAERTVYQWLAAHEEFAQSYARAREVQQDRAVDEMVQIADTASDPAKARVQVEARKWRASKLAPKKYGDKIAVGGDDSMPPIRQRFEVEFVSAKGDGTQTG